MTRKSRSVAASERPIARPIDAPGNYKKVFERGDKGVSTRPVQKLSDTHIQSRT
jgi:hypothetical protein